MEKGAVIMNWFSFFNFQIVMIFIIGWPVMLVEFNQVVVVLIHIHTYVNRGVCIYRGYVYKVGVGCLVLCRPVHSLLSVWYD